MNLSSKPIRSSRSHSCEICDDIKGKCRHYPDSGVWLCMNFADACSAPPGFKYLGTTKNYTWGKFAPDLGNLSSEQWDTLKREREALKQQRATDEAKKRAESMPAVERDRRYQQLLDQLSLSPADRADLYRRGISDEQIKAVGFKSFEQWQKLETELPHNLPGVQLDGRSLNTPYSGYLCPTRDKDGLIVGCQIRTRRPQGDDPKYYWLTSNTKKRPNGASPNLPNGELPLAIFEPGQIEQRAIAMVEGTGAKPLLLSQRLNLATIGAAGGQFASSPQTSEGTLRQLSERLQTTRIEFYPDAGACQNQQVLRQYRATWKLLQSLGYSAEIAWWGQTTKGIHQDIDELQDLDSIRFISISEFEAIAETFLPVPTNWLQRIAQTLQRKPKPLASAVALRRELGEVDEQIFEYDEGDRLKTWKQASQQGYRYILDPTAPGGGKTYDSGSVIPADFEADRVIYITGDRRNSTVPTLERWREVEARHGGLTDQSGKLRRVKPGQVATVAANCGRTEAIGVLRSKGVQGADGDVVCQTCPMLNACKHFTGEGYGFKHQRRQALMGDRLKIHPASLPDPAADFSYSQTVSIWDEAGTSIQTSRAIVVSLRDSDQLISYLACHATQQFVTLQPTLSALRLRLAGEQPRYGWNYHQIIKELPPLDSSALDWDSLLQALQPNLSGLQPPDGIDLEDFSQESQEQIKLLKAKLKQDLEELKRQEEIESAAVLSSQGRSILNKSSIRDRYDEKQRSLKNDHHWAVERINSQVRSELKSIRRSLTRNTAQTQAEQTEILNQTVLKQWLPEFLGILKGERGDLRINRGELLLTLPDNRHRAVIADSKVNIFLDATLTREHLALKVGCRPDEIFVCCQRVPKVENLTITQVTDLGKLTLQRGDDKQRRATAIASHFKEIDLTAKIIDFKKFEADGAWYRDSRGVNDFLTVKTLILIGTPIPNIASLLSEYSILTGQHPTEEDEGFKAFVDRTTRAEFIQAIGRLRAHRRPDEQLQIVILSDFDLGIPTNKVKASQITIEAADKSERLQLAFKAAANQLKAEGEKITQTAIAKLTGYSQQYLSRFWKLLLSLLETPYRESSKNSDPPPPLITSLAEGIDSAINEHCETADQVLQTISEAFFEWVEPDQRAQFWQSLKAQTQIRILEVLSLTLPPDQIRELRSLT